MLPVGAQTPSSAPHQEEEAGNRGASSGAGPQTPAEWSSATGSFPCHIAEGVESADIRWSINVVFYNSRQLEVIFLPVTGEKWRR